MMAGRFFARTEDFARVWKGARAITRVSMHVLEVVLQEMDINVPKSTSGLCIEVNWYMTFYIASPRRLFSRAHENLTSGSNSWYSFLNKTCCTL